MTENLGTAFLQQHPEIQRVEIVYVDMNGVPRGKWASPTTLAKLYNGGFKLPLSSYLLNIWGANPPNMELVVNGDPDAICKGVAHSMALMPWSKIPTAQCLVSMFDQDDTAQKLDSRAVLDNVVQRFSKIGLRPVIAPEIEFYLFDRQLDAQGQPQAPKIVGSDNRYFGTELLSLDELSDFEDFFIDVHAAAKAMNIQLETSIKECSVNQFEINLAHIDDPLLMADHVFMLKRIIKGCAKKHHLAATFMAMPFTRRLGNGLHVHVSLIDENGNNVCKYMNGHTPDGVFAQAIAGILQAAPDFMGFYAPHANSYRRFNINSLHSPSTLSWGYENRSALVRLPEASQENTRLEFRAAGCDTNPYLVIAALLASIVYGIEQKLPLSPETTGNANKQHPKILSQPWHTAIDNLSESKIAHTYFGTDFIKSYQQIKNSEIDMFASTVTDFELRSYLRTL